MVIQEFKIRRIHWPETAKEDDYIAIRINGQMYRTEDVNMVTKEIKKFLEKEQ